MLATTDLLIELFY